MRQIQLALTAKDFEALVTGREIAVSIRPTSGLMTERRITEMFDLHITLQDIGYDVMQRVLDNARMKSGC